MMSTAGETPPPQPPPPFLREDCWSQGETLALIESWGSHHLSLNRGKLRHHHWLSVADSVNSDAANLRRHRTDGQCKNRMDTLKKRYKLEKAKSSSTWPFFSRLDFLISGGSNSPSPTMSPATKTPDRVAVVPVRFPVRRRSAIPKRPARWLVEVDEEEKEREGMSWRGVEKEEDRRRSPSREKLRREVALRGGDKDEEGRRGAMLKEEYVEQRAVSLRGGDERRKRWLEEADEGEEERGRGRVREGKGNGRGWRELAGAISKLGEVYERMEEWKKKELIEMEKQRMEFIKDLESERMKLIINTQLELARFPLS